jgi:hypothetical protein
MQPIAEVLSSPFSSIVTNERHGDHMSSVSYSAYDPGHHATHWDSHAAFGPPRTLWSTSPDRQPLFPHVDQEGGTLWQSFLDQSSAYPPHACSSRGTHSHHPSLSNDKNLTEPSIPHSSPRSFSPTLPHFGPYPPSKGFLETDHRPNLAFYRVPHWNFTGSSRRRCAARAIEHDGLWVDEGELLKGLTEPDGKLTVHQCRWDEDHSPCLLWIRGDKSSINTHIQKWHGGEPGGDKLQVDCRWSACGKTMLKESIARHIVPVHLGEVWECQGCGKEIVRNDAYGRHAVRSGFDACRTSGALITYSVDARVIDARVALESGGRLRYAGA